MVSSLREVKLALSGPRKLSKLIHKLDLSQTTYMLLNFFTHTMINKVMYRITFYICTLAIYTEHSEALNTLTIPSQKLSECNKSTDQ